MSIFLALTTRPTNAGAGTRRRVPRPGAAGRGDFSAVTFTMKPRVRSLLLTAALTAAFVSIAVVASAPVAAQTPPNAAPSAAPGGGTEAPQPQPSSRLSSQPAPQIPPVDATAALERVRAAYEYGDIDAVVEWSRPVAEGRLSATPVERGYALRYLGIGLYLTGRAPGAEAAFLELLRLRPDSTLDPRTTRPDVVAFFERLRSHHAEEIRATARENNHKIFVLNLLPPFGQVQNGHKGRALIFGGIEVVSLGTAITTFVLLSRSEMPHHVHADYSLAQTTKVVNIVAVALFAATYIAGVLDGFGGYSDLPDDTPARDAARVALTLDGLALTF